MVSHFAVVFVVVFSFCFAAESDAKHFRRVLTHEQMKDVVAKRDYDYDNSIGPVHESHMPSEPIGAVEAVLMKDSGPVDNKLEAFLHASEGLGINFEVFGTKIGDLMAGYFGGYYKAALPMAKAVPAPVMKDSAINLMKVCVSTIEKLQIAIKKQNPFHPSADVESNAIKRELEKWKRQIVESPIVTLTSWGDSLGKLIGAVDNVIVDLADALATQLDEAKEGVQSVILQMEMIPPSMIKDLVIETIEEYSKINTLEELEELEG